MLGDPLLVEAEPVLAEVADDGFTRDVPQRVIIRSMRGSDDARTRTWMSPSRWSRSSSTRKRPMKPVAPVTKYDMAARLLRR